MCKLRAGKIAVKGKRNEPRQAAARSAAAGAAKAAQGQPALLPALVHCCRSALGDRTATAQAAQMPRGSKTWWAVSAARSQRLRRRRRASRAPSEIRVAAVPEPGGGPGGRAGCKSGGQKRCLGLLAALYPWRRQSRRRQQCRRWSGQGSRSAHPSSSAKPLHQKAKEAAGVRLRSCLEPEISFVTHDGLQRILQLLFAAVFPSQQYVNDDFDRPGRPLNLLECRGS